MESEGNYVSARFGSDYGNSEARGHFTYQQDQRESTSRVENTKMGSSGRFDETSYQDYPRHRPFIHDDYRREIQKPIIAYPESNRQNVMSALRGLQEKIRNLEIERSHAEENLQTLAGETSRCVGGMKGTTTSEPLENGTSDDEHVDYPHSNNVTLMGNTTTGTDVHGKLDAVEHRCELLEKQLEYMRKVVQSAENDRSDALRRTTMFEEDNDSSQTREIKNKLDKIQDLERENLKLTATQTLVENKIREMEQKLREEKHIRKLMQDREAEGKTVAETDRILYDVVHQGRPKKMKKKQKSKSQKERRPRCCSANGTKKSTNHMKSGQESSEHYRLNLAEIPFIAGKSTGPSHSLAANFQNVLSLMKSHNPRLCRSPRSHLRSGYKYLSPQRHTPSTLSEVNGSTDSELDDLMMQLQDEFGHMSFEHEELNKQIQEAVDPRLGEDLERELDHLVARMEAKGEQISRLRRHQEQIHTRQAKKMKRSTRQRSASPQMEMGRNQEDIEVTTTVRTKGKKIGSVVINPTSTNKAQASLNLYKDLKKIQSTLQKDDICWE